MRKLSFFVLLSALLLPACGSKLPSLKPFKLDIQQGNVVTSKMLLQLRPGMTKSQVRFIMGTPLVVDGFHDNRWDYFYAMRKQGQVVEKRRVILDFEKDALLRVRGDVVPEGDPAAKVDTAIPPTSVAKAPAPAEKSMWQKLKFWGDDEPAQTSAPVPSPAPAPVAEQKVAEQKPAEEKSWWQSFKFWGDDTPVPAAATAVAVEAKPAIPELKATPDPVVEAATKETGVSPAPVESAAEMPVVENKVTEAPASVPAVTPVQETLTAQEAVVPAMPAVADATEAIASSVANWAEAWRSKNVKAYLANYADDFKPEGLPSKKAWEAQRKQRLSPKQGAISLDVSNVQVQQNGNQATVQFVQNYASKVYRDQVSKQLDLRLDPATNTWLIVRETTLKNAPMPTKQQVIAPEGTEEHLDGVIEQIGF